jgi:glycosyltransferase involved in cell wall biosynthesis
VTPLKVCLLVNDLRIGGAERQLVELATGLDTRRFQPLVVTLYPGHPLEADLVHAGVPVVSLDRRGRFDFGAVWRLRSLLRREDVSVIQPFLTPATFFGLTASILAGTPVRVVTERCGLRVNPGAGSNVYRFLEDRLTRFAAVAVPNSCAGAAYLRSRGIGSRKIRVIYNGVSPDRVSAPPQEVAAVRAGLGIPAEAPVVGIVASLQEAKDHRTFLAACALVREHYPAAHFVIVGDGELRTSLEKQAIALGLGAATHFTGNQARVAPLVASFDVSVLSSFDHEGCSNSILEAMGLARPVVCTDVGGNAELVQDGENGFVVPPKSPEAMAGRIMRLLGDPALSRSLGEAGRRRFQADFMLATMVRNYEDLYAELWAARTGAENETYRRGEAREA